MFESYRVVVVTPAGRRRYLEILLPYVLQARPLVDEYQLWVNTADDADVEYLVALERAHPGFVRLVWPSFEPRGRLTVRHFYAGCTDRQTLYVKLDDDICFVERNALPNLLRFRRDRPEFFLVYANVVNSALSSHIHQRMGALDESVGIFPYDPFSSLGWRSGPAASFVHRQFLKRVHQARLDQYFFERWVWNSFERASINCIAWFGRDFHDFAGRVEDEDDEHWLSVEKPRRLGRPNCVCGTSLVVHFAYQTQREYLEAQTDLLTHYRSLALGLATAP